MKRTSFFSGPGSEVLIFLLGFGVAPSLVAVLIATGSCTTVVAAPPPCPPLEEPAEVELVAACGDDLSQCPMLEVWLGDVARHCDAVDAQR